MTFSIEEVVRSSEVIVISRHGLQFAEAVQQHAADRLVIDLVQLSPESHWKPANYDGICW